MGLFELPIAYLWYLKKLSARFAIIRTQIKGAKSKMLKGIYPFLVFFLLFASLANGLEQRERKKILVLFSFRPTMPIATQWAKGIRSILGADQEFEFIINIEHLDLSHAKDNQLSKLLVDLYGYKYKNPKPDLIIPVLNASVDLVLEHGADIFPNVPVVFGGVEKEFVDNIDMPPNFTGYLTDINYRETLDLAIKLHPETRHIVVIGGAGPIVKKWINSLRREYKEYEDSLEFSYLTGMPMPNLLEEVKNLPSSSIIISLPILLDGAGKEFVGKESRAMITKVAAVPVYSFWNLTLGTGVVGGYMGSFEREAEEVARLGLRILNGEKPSDIPITQVPKSRYMFDWRQLRRWSISEDELPPGSIVLFKEFTLWDKYQYQIIFLAILFSFLISIISYLLFQKKSLFRAKEKLSIAEQKYKTVSDFTYDWEYWQDSDKSMQYVSPSCRRISDYSAQEFIDKPALLREIIFPEDRKIWDRHICGYNDDGKSEIIQFRIKRADGEIRWVEHVCLSVFNSHGKERGVRASNRDITEREFYKTETHQLRSELAHMDRLVTVSALTSALAHEINQPLAAMRSYAQAGIRFLESEKPDVLNTKKALHGIVDDNKRAASIINKLRQLVKKRRVQKELLKINSVIGEVLTLMNSEIVRQNASIHLEFHHQVSVVFGDLIQIQQVLINLLTNALDAMGTQPIDARTISISTKPENQTSTTISISDTGSSIPSELMETIFEPFVTTKSKGIGFGLSICRSIVKAHDGEITVKNNTKGGTTFSLTLPSISQA